MKKIDISDEIKREIYEKYLSNLSIRKIKEYYPYSFSTILKIINSYNYENILNKNYPEKKGYKLIVECKKTKKKFDVYKNISGALTTHIIETYHIKLPSNYKRKKNEYKTGKFWYHDYFNFKYIKTNETKKCFYCDWETNDINNTSGAYEKHLKKIHHISIIEHLKNYPNDKSYFKKEVYDKLIECKICGKSFKSISNTHLKKHNITPLEYKIKYDNIIISEKTKEKLSLNYNNYLKEAAFQNN